MFQKLHLLKRFGLIGAAGAAGASCFVAGSALAVDNILPNPSFLDLDEDGALGDGVSPFGAASFNTFFGDNPHASLFPDRAGNIGGVFQTGLAATPGVTYQFDLLNTRIESNFDADLVVSLEFFADDDETLIGETRVVVDVAERLALPNVDPGGSVNGAVVSIQAEAPLGAAFVRPVFQFENVNPNFPDSDAPSGQAGANVFVFDTFLSETPAPGGNLLRNPGFEDLNGDGNFGDSFGNFGSTGFNNFFAGEGEEANGHASLFGDFGGDSGGIFQQGILAEAGTEYTFQLTDVLIEESFDADLSLGIQFFASDDFTLIGESATLIDTSTTGSGLAFEINGTAPEGAVFARPFVSFENVNPLFLAEPDTSVFIFDAIFAEVVDDVLALEGDYNGDGFVAQADLDLVLLNFGSDLLPDGFDAAAVPGGEGFDGLISQNELDGVLLNFGNGTPPTAVAAVPEPTTAALLGLAGAGLLARRRKA